MKALQLTKYDRPAVIAWLAIAIFLVGVSASAWRIVLKHQTPGPFDPARQGYCDFHNGVYFPSLAFRHGVSPYSLEYASKYPTERPTPFYSPLIFALHVPLTWLPLAAAEVTYFVFSIGLIVSIAWLSIRWATDRPPRERLDLVALTACGLLYSRGGQQTIFTGYFTLELVLAGLCAVHYASSQRWKSVLGLVIISAKPTYVLPIAGLMLFRGNFRAVIVAGVISLAGAIACFGWLVSFRSIDALRHDIEISQAIHRADPYEVPANSWTRIDVLAIVAKWSDWIPSDLTHLTSMCVLLLPAAITLAFYHRRVTDDGGVDGLSGAVVLMTATIAIYHHVYDSIIVVPVLVAMFASTRSVWTELGRIPRWLLAVCLMVPSVNYLSSQMILERLNLDGPQRQIITSLNAMALATACAILIALAWKRAQTPPRLGGGDVKPLPENHA